MNTRTRLLAFAATFAFSAAGVAQQPSAPASESVGQKADRVFDRAENAVSRTVNPPAGEPTIGQRAGKVFDQVEDGSRRVWNRVTGKAPAQPQPQVITPGQVRDDTRSMGAAQAPARQVNAPATPGTDEPRRSRMDDAYKDWQSGKR